MAMPSAHAIAYGADLVSVDVNDIFSQQYAIMANLSAKTAASWLLGPTHSFAGTTIQDALDQNYSAIAAGLGAASGTTAKQFTIYQSFAGAPVDNLALHFNRGTGTDMTMRVNEAANVLEINEAAGYSRIVAASNAETVIGGLMVQPFDRVYNADIFNPCKISGATATNVSWAPSSDPTYFAPKVYITSAQVALNYYAFELLALLPTEWADWKSATAVAIAYRTDTTKASQNHIDAWIRHKASGLAAGTSCSSATKADQKAATSGTWAYMTWDKSDLTNAGSISWAAGEYIHIKLKCEVKSSKYVEFGPCLIFAERT